METLNGNNDDLFNPTNIPSSNWFKYEKVGDRVAGEVVDIFEKPSTDPNFPDQKVFVLKQANGELINAPIKKTSDYLMQRTNRVQVGDRLGFAYEKDIPPKQKGLNPAKSIQPYWQPKALPTVEE